jgi:hypothetical protein
LCFFTCRQSTSSPCIVRKSSVFSLTWCSVVRSFWLVFYYSFVPLGHHRRYLANCWVVVISFLHAFVFGFNFRTAAKYFERKLRLSFNPLSSFPVLQKVTMIT